MAVCDVDSKHAEGAKARVGGKADVYGDYRKLLDRKDVEVVTITTPDHWHTKIAIDAMKKGKDVYCEKPLTLTIDEGKQICKAVKETGRVFQVGTQQRKRIPPVSFSRRSLPGSRRADRRSYKRSLPSALGTGPAKRAVRPLMRGAARIELGRLARPSPVGRLHRASLPRRFPLVV